MQVAPGPAGPLMDGLREVLDPWLGEARWKQSQGRVTFSYRFLSEDVPAMRIRLKVEINSREHFAVLGFTKRAFSVDSRGYSGMADIATFELDELLATKLRVLYQRRKGRDLFDLAMGRADKRSDAQRIVAGFGEYLEREGGSVTRALPCSLMKRLTASSIHRERWPRDTVRSSILTVCSGSVMLSLRFIGDLT